jgi:ankyrin repeat protein
MTNRALCICCVITCIFLGAGCSSSKKRDDAKQPPQAEIKVQNDWSELMRAVYEGDTAKASTLLKDGAEPNVSDKEGWTPLSIAIIRKHPAIVSTLLEKDTLVVESRDKDGFTPLMFACGFMPDAAIIQTLISRGAAVNSVSKTGWTPLMIALTRDSHDITKILVDSGADVDASDKDGWRPLMFASAYSTKVETMKLLLDKNASVDVSTSSGWTPLSIAQHNGKLYFVQELRQAGASR